MFKEIRNTDIVYILFFCKFSHLAIVNKPQECSKYAMSVVPVAITVNNPKAKAVSACNITKYEYFSWSTKYLVVVKIGSIVRDSFKGLIIFRIHGQNGVATIIIKAHVADAEEYFRKFIIINADIWERDPRLLGNLTLIPLHPTKYILWAMTFITEK